MLDHAAAQKKLIESASMPVKRATRGTRAAKRSLENPCVNGSIPPRTTKNIVHATPTITDWRFRFWIS